jgi:hypothetical protein
MLDGFNTIIEIANPTTKIVPGHGGVVTRKPSPSIVT